MSKDIACVAGGLGFGLLVVPFALACVVAGALALLWAVPFALVGIVIRAVWAATLPRGDREGAWGGA